MRDLRALWASEEWRADLESWLLPALADAGLAVTAAALRPWTDRATWAELRALLPAADRISALHRAVSWRRLVEDVPLSAVDPALVRSYAEWLLIATDPDPYARAVTM